jgi:hypothetical protein
VSGFDRERILLAFWAYRDEAGSDVRSLDELATMSDAELALYTRGVVEAFQAVSATTNGGTSPLAPPLDRLMRELNDALGEGV